MATKIPEIKGRELNKMRYQARTFMNRWKKKGGKLTTYFCPGCRTHRRTIQPMRREVGSKGCWNSAKTCTRCGEIHHVSVYSNGKTIVHELPKMKTAMLNVATLELRQKG